MRGVKGIAEERLEVASYEEGIVEGVEEAAAESTNREASCGVEEAAAESTDRESSSREDLAAEEERIAVFEAGYDTPPRPRLRAPSYMIDVYHIPPRNTHSGSVVRSSSAARSSS